MDSVVLAAVEPLGVLHFLGLDDRLAAETITLLARHAETCLTEQGCVDPETGGLKLSSTSNNSWTSKVALSLYVLQNVLGFDIHMGQILEEFRRWCQVYAKRTTISDQILVSRREVIGGCYYPRAVTMAFWLYQ